MPQNNAILLLICRWLGWVVLGSWWNKDGLPTHRQLLYWNEHSV